VFFVQSSKSYTAKMIANWCWWLVSQGWTSQSERQDPYSLWTNWKISCPSRELQRIEESLS